MKLCIKGAEHLRAHRTITLPSLLDLIALDLAQRASNSNTARQIRARNLLHEPESADLVLPVSNIYNKKIQSACLSSKPQRLEELTLRPDLNQFHPGIFRPTSVHSISQISKPGLGPLGPDFFDARVRVVARHALAGDGDPVLVAGVEEGDGRFGRAVLEVVEFLGVCVGEEEEVGAGAFGDGHGAADGLGRGC